MAKLAKKKPDAPKAPKKPTSRSKTGNAECSAAASNWQLAIRGKASLSPDTYQTLAKCRALSSTKKRADAYGRTGKLSDMGAAALSARADKRFSQGLVTQKSRTDRLNMLLKQRSEQQNAKPSTVVNKTIGLRKDGLMTSGHIRAMKAEPKGTGESSFEVWKTTQTVASSEQAKRSAKAGMLLKQRSERGKPIGNDDIEPVPAEYRNYRLAPASYVPPKPKASKPAPKTGYDPETAVEKSGGVSGGQKTAAEGIFRLHPKREKRLLNSHDGISKHGN